MTLTRKVNGVRVTLSADEEAAVRAEWATDVLATADQVSAHAEALINAGVDIGGVQFRCDTDSISRISGLLTWAENLEADSQSVSVSFVTSAGVTVSVTSAAQARAIHTAASGHVAAVLSASTAIQAALGTMTTTEMMADSRWPS